MDGPAERLYPSDHFKYLNAAVAQWIEYWPPKPRVVGSIPASRTNNSPRKPPAGFQTVTARLLDTRVWLV